MSSRLIAFAPVVATEPNAGVWANPVDGLIVSVATIIMAVGVAIVIWGAYCSVIRLIAVETATARLRSPNTDTAPVRLSFAAYLLPGLDFLIAGSVIKTLAVSDWHQAAVLGSIVLVRVLLGVGMKWEAGPASAEKSSLFLETSLAAAAEAVAATAAAVKNGALPGKHLPEPPAPGAEQLTKDPASVAGQTER
jgi:uncharacterized membrane protein